MNRLLILLVLLVTASHTSIYPLPDYLYYGTFWGILMLLVLRGRKFEFQAAYVPFILSVLFSLWVNDTPAVFRAPVRAVAFFVIVFTVGPFVVNQPLVAFRRSLFVYVLFFIRWVVILSFVGYLLGVGFVHNRSGFCGFTYHSMLLGPLAGVAALHYFYWIFLFKDIQTRLLNSFWLCISMLTLVLTGSRSALGACIVGLFFFVFVVYRKRLSRMLQIFFVFTLVVAATFSVWWPYTERLRDKMEYGEELGSSTASRDLLWMDRLAEFQAYPIFGVGFASYNIDIAQNKLNKETGTIEPGSSWLFLLSSMGLMGLLSFLLPIGGLFIRAYTLQTDILNNAFLASLLSLFVAHMFFEGYVVASGAYLCFFLWLVLSECYTRLIRN